METMDAMDGYNGIVMMRSASCDPQTVPDANIRNMLPSAHRSVAALPLLALSPTRDIVWIQHSGALTYAVPKDPIWQIPSAPKAAAPPTSEITGWL